jgi:cytochrome c peroxidase
MHAGQLATLEDVVDYYSHITDAAAPAGTRDAALTNIAFDAGEKADLVAFLKTLSGEPVAAALLADTSAP